MDVNGFGGQEGSAVLGAPPLTWRADRVLSDLELSAKIIVKVDSEKGILGNKLLDEWRTLSSDTNEHEEESKEGLQEGARLICASARVPMCTENCPVGNDSVVHVTTRKTAASE